MGILYAKVSGAWVPILGGSGGGGEPDWTLGFPTYDPRYVNAAGDTMSGDLVFTGSGGINVTGTGNLTINGPGAINASASPISGASLTIGGPTTLNGALAATTGSFSGVLGVGNATGPTHAMNQQTADGRYVDIAGDTMTGLLTVDRTAGAASEGIRLTTTDTGLGPFIALHNNVGRVGYLQARASTAAQPGFALVAEQSLPMIFHTGGAERFRIRDGSAGETFTVANTPACLIYFRDSSPSGTAKGYVGFDATWGMRVTANEGTALFHAAAGDARIQGQEILFYPGATYAARFNTGGGFVMGKTTGENTTAGLWINNTTVGMTNDTANTPPLMSNKVGAGIASGCHFVNFRLDNANIGSITRNAATSAVLYNLSSDYRLKEDRGLITGALERLALLKPRRIVWKSDPDETEMDGFFAHEVAEAAPHAVTGEKDAVSTETNEDMGTVEGQIIPQQLDQSQLIPLLVAAVQELAARVDALPSTN